MTAERSDPAAAAGQGGGQAPIADLPRSVEDALAAIFDNAGPPSRDMGWIAQAEPVRSIRPQPQLQLKPQPQPRPPRRSGAVPIVMGSVLAIAGLLGGAYLSEHPIQRRQQPLLALEMFVPKPLPTPKQPVGAIPPPASIADQASVGPASPVAQLPAIDRPEARTPSVAPPPVARAAVKIADRPRRHDDIASAMRGVTAECYGRASCDHHTLARADQLLVTAYAQATAAGVSGSALAEYRRRWDNLRNDSADSPQILVGNYAVLADDLNRSTSAAQAPRSRRSSPEAQP